MLLFAAVNVLGVRWLSETNKVAVWWKIAIPVVAVIVLIVVAFHPGNFTAGGGFSPFGWKGILQAIPIGGVIFAYLGFEQAIQLGAETQNPKRNIPLAVIGSMILGVILYLGLDLAFVGAINPSDLSHGWHNLSKVFNGTYGPFAAIFSGLGLTFFAVLIYIDAVISPGGTGLLYVGTSARLTFALARNRYIPSFFAALSARGVPVFAIAFSFIVGMIVFLPFPSWSALVGFISSATVIAYAMAPLAMGALRMQDPDRERPFKLWGGTVLAPLGFVVANEIILFSGWPVVWKLVLAIVVGFVLLAISLATSSPQDRPSLDMRAGAWVWPYVIGLLIISYFSSFTQADLYSPSWMKGGTGQLAFGVDVAVMAVFSVAIYLLAIKLRLPSERAVEYIGDLTAEAEAEEAEVAR
jgi:amino acid transporter